MHQIITVDTITRSINIYIATFNINIASIFILLIITGKRIFITINIQINITQLKRILTLDTLAI